MKRSHVQETTQPLDSIAVNWKERIMRINGISAALIILIGAILWIGSEFITRLIDDPSTAIRTEAAAQTATISQEHRNLNTQHEAIIKTQERIADTLEIQTFLMTKSDMQRYSYKLDEPESLKRKLHGR